MKNLQASSRATDIKDIRRLEPAFVLIPNRIRSSTAAAVSSIGPCTSLASIPRIPSFQPSSKENDVWIASGHLNGWIVLWSLNKRRSTRQWLAHPQAQVSSLHCLCQDSCILASQGRDGFIRFWSINSIYPPQTEQTPSQPDQVLSEIRTCEFTFCQMTIWPASAVGSVQSKIPIYYLAHIGPGEDESSGHTKGADIEILQLPDNVIVSSTSVDQHGPASSGLSNLGMCMALQGISESHSADPSGRCLLITAFESGHLFLLSRGQVLARLDNALGEAVPIMSLAVLSHPEIKSTCLIALGGPSPEVSSQPARTLAFVNLSWDTDDRHKVNLIPIRDKLPVRSCGVSSMMWRSDARILAIGQWDGDIRLIETKHTRNWRVHQLGWLASLGAIDSGELLGEWAATTVREPHGPIIDQQSTTVRALLFTPESHWLISSAPASAGAVGSLLLWDVYRTKDDVNP